MVTANTSAALLSPITEREESKQSAVKMAGKEEWPAKNAKSWRHE
jgi:hypothetical protein